MSHWIICPICGIEFVRTSKTPKYCSIDCMVISRKIRELEAKKMKAERFMDDKVFSLVLIDLENFYVQLSRKYHKLIPDYSKYVFDKLIKYNVDVKHEYVIYWFTGNIPNITKNHFDNKYNKWIIETEQKGIRKTQTPIFASSDTKMVGIALELMIKYRPQINHVYLGSGDIDMKIIVDRCESYNLPLTIFSFDKTTTHNTYQKSSHDIIYLEDN